MDSIGWIVPHADTVVEFSYAFASDGCTTKAESCRDVSTKPWEVGQCPFSRLAEKPEFLRSTWVHLSPIVWRNSRRNKEEFKSASFLATDFDTPAACMNEVCGQVEALGLRHWVYTTQSHQKPKPGRNGNTIPPCDRYRIFAALDRPITDPGEYELFYACVLLSPLFRHADRSCADRARIYCGGNEDSEVRYHPGENVISVDGLIRAYSERAKTRQRAAQAGGSAEAAKLARELKFDEHTCKADGNIINQMSKYCEGTQWHTENTCERIHGTIAHALRLRPDPYLIAACTRAWPFYQEWLSRHPERADDLPVQVATALLDVAGSGLVRKYIVPPNPVVEFNWHVDLPDDMKASVIKLQSSRGIVNPQTSQVDELFYHCMTSPEATKSIISAPCGLGKTTSAIAYAACQATAQNPVWIVTGTRTAAKDIRTELTTVYGMRSGFLTGYDPDECTRKRRMGSGRARLMYDKRKTPCHRCPDNDGCAFYRSHFIEAARNAELAMPVVLMTHHMFMRLLALNQVPATVTVVIDEEPRRWERLSLTSTFLDQLDGKFALRLKYGDGDHINEQAGWRRFRDALDAAMKRAKDSGGGVWAEAAIPTDLLRTLIRRLHEVEDQDSADKRRWTAESSEFYDRAYAVMRFFGYSARKAVFYTPQDATWYLSTDTVEFTLPNRVVILNASAMYSPVKWEGATVYRIADKRRYSNTHLHLLIGNPTKSYMKKKLTEFMAKAGTIVDHARKPVVFVAMDKTGGAEELADWVQQLEAGGSRALCGTRGSINGSNEFNRATRNIMFMATFRDLSDYVLTAMHATQEEIPRDRIWSADDKPQMHNGFTDDLLNQQLLRSHVDELYQTIMRGIIRSDPSAEYHICAIVLREAVAELTALLPGATVHTDDKVTEFIASLHQMDAQAVAGLSTRDMEAAVGEVSRGRPNLTTLRSARNQIAIERLLQGVLHLYRIYTNEYTLNPALSSESGEKNNRGNPNHEKPDLRQPGAPMPGVSPLPCRITVLAA